MDDSVKPRRSRAEELAEIHEHIVRREEDSEARFARETQLPPGLALLLEEEAALQAQKDLEEELFNEIVDSDPEFFFGSRL
jgi:hypothetical protein